MALGVEDWMRGRERIGCIETDQHFILLVMNTLRIVSILGHFVASTTAGVWPYLVCFADFLPNAMPRQYSDYISTVSRDIATVRLITRGIYNRDEFGLPVWKISQLCLWFLTPNQPLDNLPQFRLTNLPTHRLRPLLRHPFTLA